MDSNINFKPSFYSNSCCPDIHIKIDKLPAKGNFEEMGSSANNKKQRSPRESLAAKIAHFLGAILQILLVGLPQDLCRWLRLRRKCVQGQTVVITGGASGIGQRLAEMFADPCTLGARVAILDANLEGAERAVQAITKAGGQARAWQCDIVDGEKMGECAEEIQKYFGRVDIVICNAAILYFASTLELKDAEIQRAMNVNLLGTINTIRAFLPQMEAQGRGQIVAISSIAGFFGETFGMAYCPTKFAVRGAMECLRMELRDRGLEQAIPCTTICPFFVRTPMILNRGIRPISRWIPFMSIERCASQIVDAVLKEKVLAFMPPWLSLLTAINSLFSLNMQRIARDFINCRYEELGEGERMEGENAEEKPEKMNGKIGEELNGGKLAKCPAEKTNGPNMENIKGEREEEEKLRKNRELRRQMAMRDYFEWANPVWWALIPPAMLLTFLTAYSPELVNVPWLSVVGQFAYKMGTEHPQLMLWVNIFAWAAHLLEAIAALYLTDSLRLAHKCAFLWFAQTLALGYPSLRLLLKFRRKIG